VTGRHDYQAGPSPWLGVPAADYLGHMASPGVGQLPVLAEALRSVLAQCRPRDLLVLGCATGNGWEHIDPAVTRTVVGIDVNAEYLGILRERFSAPGYELTLRCEDLATADLPASTFDLVHGALVLEYLDWPALLPRLARALRPAGALSVVLQLPSATVPAVTPSAFPSLLRLEPLFRFVGPEKLLEAAESSGLMLRQRREVVAAQGKRFLVLALGREG